MQSAGFQIYWELRRIKLADYLAGGERMRKNDRVGSEFQ